MVKPTSKAKKSTQTRLGNVTKAGITGKKGLASLQNIAAPISNKQQKCQGSSANITNLVAVTHGNNTDSIVDQDVDVSLAGVPNHSFLSLQKLQGDILDNDDNKEDDNNDNDNDDNHFGMDFNTTLYDGRKNTVAAVVEQACFNPF